MPKKRRPQPLAPQGAKTISLVKKFCQKHRYIYSFPALVTSSATRSLFPPFLQPYPPPPGHNRRRRAASPPTSCVLADINRRIPLSLIAPCTYLAPSTSFSPKPNPNHHRIVGRRRTGSASPSTRVHRTRVASPLTTTDDEHLVYIRNLATTAMVATRGQGTKRPAEQEQGKQNSSVLMNSVVQFYCPGI